MYYKVDQYFVTRNEEEFEISAEINLYREGQFGGSGPAEWYWDDIRLIGPEEVLRLIGELDRHEEEVLVNMAMRIYKLS